ncbi:uncharacterized protein LOC127095453 [Lathyrus oleraceus]|uniref:uncharacterized protein LOC127095453 n=1 Tax=Pisum sativum TaxID=3888 RepID=UPI0021D0B2EA|nr:uncharacterized protein LOC127095453 [Pisum sativum]
MVVKASEISQSIGPGKDFDPVPSDKGQNKEKDQRLDVIYDDEPLGFEKDPLATNIKMLAQDPLEEVDLGEGRAGRIETVDQAWEEACEIEPKTICSINTVEDQGGMEEILVDFAAGYEYLSMLDGYFGYNQIFITEEDIPKTAFCCRGALGIDEWAGDFLGFVVHKKAIEINQNKTKVIMEVKAPSTKKGLQSLLGNINFLRRFISNLSGKTQAFSPLIRLNKEVFEWTLAQQEAFDKIKAYLSHPPILTPPCRNKSMRLYISASDKTLGSMLAQEDDNGIERDIYYLNRVLNDVETSRIGKWALALTEFSLTYMPLRAVKGQVVADFIVDHSIDANALKYVELGPWKLYFDGSSHKDGTGVRVVIISPNKIPTKFQYKVEGTCSNNEAEYEALIAGLEMLLELGTTRVEIMGDSELVIKQITKEYRCVKENLIMYFIIASLLLKRFEMVYIRHIPRLENQVANDLAQIAFGYKIAKEKLHKVIEVRGKVVATRLMPLDLEKTKLGYTGEGNFEILAIDNLTDEDWRKPIVVYLQNLTVSTDRKTRYGVLSYVLLGTELFKKSPEGILLKCLCESEAYFALSTVHRGACGAHQIGHKMKWRLFHRGMYWPTMLKDCIEFAKGYQECQMHAGIQHVPASE